VPEIPRECPAGKAVNFMTRAPGIPFAASPLLFGADQEKLRRPGQKEQDLVPCTPNSESNLVAAHNGGLMSWLSLTFLMLPQRMPPDIRTPHKLRRETVVSAAQMTTDPTIVGPVANMQVRSG
jgi:hypothetical protein